MLPADIEVSTDRARLDVALIEQFLNTSYWAAGRPRDVIERSIAHSLCFGVYTAGRQIGFARVITDCAVFGYLADVFVLPEFRGRGVGKHLVKAMLEHPDVHGLKLLLLRTRDAHGLYAQFGFAPPEKPEELMTRWSAALQ
jgi:GNAT superfamily N-acetyltransferase